MNLHPDHISRNFIAAQHATTFTHTGMQWFPERRRRALAGTTVKVGISFLIGCAGMLSVLILLGALA